MAVALRCSVHAAKEALKRTVASQLRSEHGDAVGCCGGRSRRAPARCARGSSRRWSCRCAGAAHDPGVSGASRVAPARRRARARRDGLVHGAAHGRARPTRPATGSDPERPARRRARRRTASSSARTAPPWITDGGLNAIVRVDPDTHRGDGVPAADRAGTRTSTRRRSIGAASSGSPGQSGVYGRARSDDRRECACSTRRAAPVRTASTTTPAGAVYYASLAGSHIARIDPRPGSATVARAADARPGRAPRLVGLEEAASGSASGTRARSRATTRPAPLARVAAARREPAALRRLRRRPRHRLADRLRRQRDRPLRPATEHSGRPLPTPGAAVRQLLGRPGEVWGAESGADKLVVVRTG